MDHLDVGDVAYENMNRGYASQWELMSDLFALIDYRLYLHYKYHQWVGPGNDMKNMLGLVVTRAEFEHNLAKSAQSGLCRRVTEEERRQMLLSDEAVRGRLRATEADIPLIAVMERFSLPEFERSCLILAYAAALDAKYEKLFAYLQDDITKKTPSAALAVQLYLPDESPVEEFMALFERKTPFTSLFDEERLAAGFLELRPCVTEFLASSTVSTQVGMTLFDGAADEPDGPLVIRQNVARELDVILASRENAVVSICGPAGCGKRFQVKHLMARAGESCLFADLGAMRGVSDVNEAALIARLTDVYLCFFNPGGVETDALRADLIRAVGAVKPCRGKLFLLSEQPVYRFGDAVTVDVVMESASPSERLALFTHCLRDVPLSPELSLREVASKFRFEPVQIRQACEHAAGARRVSGAPALDSATLHRCCYRQVVHELDALASRVEPKFDWDDVVLPEPQKRLMRHACSHVRYQHQVYYDWGFDRKISYGRGLSILFAGAPGTGKTMCAQVIARNLNMEMYKINISQIVSKYIGETEKNLQAVFSEARRSNCILFFDECDAIFGKRSEVKDAHDRNANVEVAYLLQQIEEFDGVCILATNLIANIDAAFMRRITYVVHFPFPDAAMRKMIYLRTLPAAAPVDEDVDWDFVSEKFELSGGHIKNIVLSAAFMAAAEKRPINMRHVLSSAVNELKKNEIVVVREDLREYADLIFDEA